MADQTIQLDKYDDETRKYVESYYEEEDYPSSQMKNSSQSFTPDEVVSRDVARVERYRVLERFTKVKVPFYRIFNKQDGSETIVDGEKYQELRSAHEEERFDDIPYCKNCDQLWHVPESLVWTNMQDRQYKQSKWLEGFEIN